MSALSSKQVKCDICEVILSFNNESTTSLIHHLQSRHIVEFDVEKNRRQPQKRHQPDPLPGPSGNKDILCEIEVSGIEPRHASSKKQSTLPLFQPAIDTTIENL